MAASSTDSGRQREGLNPNGREEELFRDGCMVTPANSSCCGCITRTTTGVAREAIPCRIARQRRAVTGGDVGFLLGVTPKSQLGTSVLSGRGNRRELLLRPRRDIGEESDQGLVHRTSLHHRVTLSIRIRTSLQNPGTGSISDRLRSPICTAASSSNVNPE